MGKNTKEKTKVRDFQENIAREGQSDWGSQDGTARKDRQDKRARTELPGQK